VSLAKAKARQAYEDAWRSYLDSPKAAQKSLVEPHGAALSAALLLDRQAGNFGGAALCHFPTDRDAPDYKAYRKRGLWQAGVLRCVFGPLPFRPVSLDPAVLAWRDATVVHLARAAYDEKLPAGTLDNGRLAVLADALEEAGCTDADILGHCRSGGEHVRGCWVVDLLLGKS
jgi:hypothetical protein